MLIILRNETMCTTINLERKGSPSLIKFYLFLTSEIYALHSSAYFALKFGITIKMAAEANFERKARKYQKLRRKEKKEPHSRKKRSRNKITKFPSIPNVFHSAGNVALLSLLVPSEKNPPFWRKFLVHHIN